MKRLKILSPFNNLHIYFFIVFFIILSFKNIIFALPLLFFLYIGRNHKKEMISLIIILFIIISLSHIQYLDKEIKESFSGLVVDKDDNINKVLTKYGYLDVYDDSLSLGDYGSFSVIKYDNLNGPFDYDSYLNNKNIIGRYKLKNFNKKNNYFVISKINYYLCSKLDQDNIVDRYILTLILGKNNSDKELKEETYKLGISHILSLSGTHLSIMLLVLCFILDKIFYFKKTKDIIKIVFLSLFIIITDFKISVMRSALLIILPIILEKKYPLLTKLDYLSLIGLSYLIIHPKYLFISEYYFSFLSSFLLIIFFQEKKNKIKQIILSSFLISLFTFPLVININYEINLLSLLFSPIYILIFEFIIFPTVLLSLFFPYLSQIWQYVFLYFERSISFFSTFKNLTFLFGHQSDLIIFIIYLLIILLIYLCRHQHLFLIILSALSSFILLLYLKPFCLNEVKIKMYDVGQGDSILVTFQKINFNILIDSYNSILSYLKYDGIKHIDLIILTHGDSDHINAFEDVYSYYGPQHLYTTPYTLKDELISLINRYDFKYLKAEDKLIFDEVELLCLGPVIKRSEENNNSLVFKLIYQELCVLFTGDMEVEEENDLVLRYGPSLRSNILKVGHHGSSTSSTKEFLELVKPDLCLISVKRNNSYNLPNNNYLLNNFNVYLTSEMGNITLIYNKNKLNIEK